MQSNFYFPLLFYQVYSVPEKRFLSFNLLISLMVSLSDNKIKSKTMTIYSQKKLFNSFMTETVII